jgi:hypothetical protein
MLLKKTKDCKSCQSATAAGIERSENKPPTCTTKNNSAKCGKSIFFNFIILYFYIYSHVYTLFGLPLPSPLLLGRTPPLYFCLCPPKLFDTPVIFKEGRHE